MPGCARVKLLRPVAQLSWDRLSKPELHLIGREFLKQTISKQISARHFQAQRTAPALVVRRQAGAFIEIVVKDDVTSYEYHDITVFTSKRGRVPPRIANAWPTM